MPTIRRLLLLAGVIAIVALATACAESGTQTLPPTATLRATATPPLTATPRPLPSPVAFEREPQGAEFGDPAFEALPGAQAHFGRLGGSIYQIEVPDDWNGRLVLYLHGFRSFAPTLTVSTPFIRDYLIGNGFAWGASSFSSNSLVPGLAADETAALWDLFVSEFGRPEYTYVTGHSMGGGGTAISAERYPRRYDGALGLCGTAGNTPQLTFLGDFFVASAVVAGVTQAEFDSTLTGELVETQILPALEDPAVGERFEAIVIDLTGGPRPLDHEGFLLRIQPNFDLIRLGIAVGLDVHQLLDNQETIYQLGPLSDVSSEEFNAAAVRVSASSLLEEFTAGQEITGDLQLPLLTLHTTGDFFVPISNQQILRRAVEAAGKGDLLVQRAVRAPGHCEIAPDRWESALEELIAWVEEGIMPEGEDLLADDLSEIGD